MVVDKRSFFDELETMTPEDRQKYQNIKLRETIEFAYLHSRAARNLLDFVGMAPSDFNTPEDLEKLPITRKTDLIEMQCTSFGGLLAPLKIERVFISPGPIYEYQPAGIPWFARSFFAAGFGKGDIVVNTFTYHMSPAGMLFHEGLRQVGATVVVMGTGNTDALIKAMLDLNINGFLGTPSFLMTVIKRIEEMGYDLQQQFALRKAWFTGEMLTSSLRRTFEEKYGLSTSQAYAVTEPGGAIAYECSAHAGMRLADEYLVEIVDPLSGRQVDPGEVGELVVTPLHNRSWGLIRFGTGDLSSLIKEPCTCGRTSYRISGIVGRSGDAVKVSGMFIVAKQAETALNAFAELDRYQILIDRVEDRDEMRLIAELKDTGINREALAGNINRKFQDTCRLKLDNIDFVERGTIPEPHKTLEDLRKWD